MEIFFSWYTLVERGHTQKVFAANFESGTWIIYDSKLYNLENLELENDTHPQKHQKRQPVDPDASIERDTWMDQNSKAAVAQLVSTIVTDHVKSKNQVKEWITDGQKPLILLNLSGVKTSTSAQSAQVE